MWLGDLKNKRFFNHENDRDDNKQSYDEYTYTHEDAQKIEQKLRI